MLEIPLLKDLISRVSKPDTVHDAIDYLNYFVSAWLLGFFALLTSGLQYCGRPIKCWVPSEFSSAWEKYTEDYCFIQSTYYIPFTKEIPDERSGHISYYRWVPIVLAIQAACFALPNVLWNVLIKKTKYNPKLVVTEARKLHNVDIVRRKDQIDNIADIIAELLHSTRYRGVNSFRTGEWTVVLLYLAIKILYLLNVATQLMLLDKFLGNNNILWGLQLITNLRQGRDWQASSLFPRVVMCDFQVRDMGNLVQHTVQCVISMNVLNEKIYLVLWCWFMLVAFCTLINLIAFIGNFFVPPMRRQLVLGYLRKSERSHYSDEELTSFADRFIGPNGILLLVFVGNHAGARVARDVIGRLFTDYAIGSLATSKNFHRYDLSFREEHAAVSQRSSSSISEMEERPVAPAGCIHLLTVSNLIRDHALPPKRLPLALSSNIHNN